MYHHYNDYYSCAGDHFYKENQSLPLEEQMITAMPDVRTRTITEDDEFFVVACDGIWYIINSTFTLLVITTMYKLQVYQCIYALGLHELEISQCRERYF